MKKDILKKLVKDILLEEKGYSNYVEGGETEGLTSETLEQILLKIAKSVEELDGPLNEDMEDRFSKDDELVDSITSSVLASFPDLDPIKLKASIRMGF